MNTIKKMRLQKALSNSGLFSRREAADIIDEGKVKVNGKITYEKGLQVDIEKDVIEVDGKVITLTIPKVYFIVNKPQGVICSLKDEVGRKKIIDLIPKMPFKIFPVGRLDYNSEGLVLLTNDGELANILMHPSYNIIKTYRVKIKGKLSQSEIKLIKKGIEIDNRKVIPISLKFLKIANNSWLEISLHEGRKHIIRKLFKKINHPIMRLKRIQIGPITAPDLKPGQFRQLTPKEIKILKQLKQQKQKYERNGV